VAEGTHNLYDSVALDRTVAIHHEQAQEILLYIDLNVKFVRDIPPLSFFLHYSTRIIQTLYCMQYCSSSAIFCCG